MAVTFDDLISKARLINTYCAGAIFKSISEKNPSTLSNGLNWNSNKMELQYYSLGIDAIDKAQVNFPEGTKFAYSSWSAIPQEVQKYVEQERIQDCQSMFAYCNNLTAVGSSEASFPLKAKTDISKIFQGCSKLKQVYITGAQNWANGNRAFQGCTDLTTVVFETYPSQPSNLESMFESCTSLTSLIPVGLEWSAGVNCNGMYKSSGLTQSIGDNFAGSTTHISSAEEMFRDCAIQHVGTMHLNDCTSCRGMFQVTDTNSGKCQLMDVGDLYTSKCVNMDNMFANQIQLVSIRSINMESCLTATNMFLNCSNLIQMVITNFGKNRHIMSIDLSSLTNWTEGVVQTFENAATRNSGNMTVKLSQATRDMISESLLSTLTSKGYNITT